MDALSSILRSVRVGSAILSLAELGAPWGVRTDGAPTGIFHAVVQGRCFLLAAGETAPLQIELEAGDVAVLPHGDAHVLCDDTATAPAHVGSLRHRLAGPEGVRIVEHGGGGEETRLVCGTFQLQHEAADALLALLPPVMHVSLRDAAPASSRGPAPDAASAPPRELGPWVDSTLRLLDEELRRGGPGAETMIERLADVLFAQVLRRHVLGTPERARGWIAAIQDGSIGRALALIHGDPAGEWSAGALASRVGMSRTRFFERFTELVGDPPARYLTRARLCAAVDLMRRRDVSTAELAALVGYGSEKAFTKVFKRHLGASPSEYRRKLRGAGAGAGDAAA